MFPADLPKVKNWPLYIFRVLGKWFSFFYFGLTSLILIVFLLPLFRLFIRPRDRFKKFARRFISAALRSFFGLMWFIGISKVIVEEREAFKKFNSKIIVANHPSLLDSVLMISLIPNADTVAVEYLKRNILTGLIKQLYILNSADYEKVLKDCEESLKLGNNLVIFPEGHRTPRTGKNILRKGAARISMASGYSIIPVHIGGTDKFGLGRKDPWLGFNPTQRYVYDVKIKDEINPQKFSSLSKPAAIRAITKEIENALFPGMKTE